MTEIVPLSQVRSVEVNAVLEAERRCWYRELEWDYSATTELIADSVSNGSVDGFALRRRRRIIAYAYFLAHAERSVIGSAHGLARFGRSDGVATLLRESLTRLIRDARTDRLESQFIYFGRDNIRRVFDDWGCQRFARQFLGSSPQELLAALGPTQFQPVRPIETTELAAVADIILDSFAGSIDAEMSACYAERSGCARFVDGVVLRNGCGIFEPRASFMVPAWGPPLGVVVTTRVGSDIAHIVQISVTSAGQGRGLGADLLRAACRGLRDAGYRKLTLSVSLDNRRAHGWYVSLGMKPRKTFDAFVWKRRP